MQVPWKAKEQTRNDIAIDEIYDFIEKMDPSLDEYSTAVSNLRKLYEMQPDPAANRLDPNTILTTGAYVVVAGAVLIFEIYGHSITSKVLSVALPKPRV